MECGAIFVLAADDEGRVPFRRPPADYALPDAVGLCPDHGGEFYVPLELPLNTPFLWCPVSGCGRHLILYSRAGGRSMNPEHSIRVTAEWDGEWWTVSDENGEFARATTASQALNYVSDLMNGPPTYPIGHVEAHRQPRKSLAVRRGAPRQDGEAAMTPPHAHGWSRIEDSMSQDELLEAIRGAWLALEDKLEWTERQHPNGEWHVSVQLPGFPVSGHDGHLLSTSVDECRALAFVCLLACIADPEINPAARTNPLR